MLDEVGLRALTLEATLVAHQPQQHEVRVVLTIHDRLEVELQVGLARQGDVVPQESQDATVADEAPEPLIRAVQQFLDQAVWRLAGRAAHTLGAAVERHVRTDQVEGHGRPRV